MGGLGERAIALLRRDRGKERSDGEKRLCVSGEKRAAGFSMAEQTRPRVFARGLTTARGFNSLCRAGRWRRRPPMDEEPAERV